MPDCDAPPFTICAGTDRLCSEHNPRDEASLKAECDRLGSMAATAIGTLGGVLLRAEQGEIRRDEMVRWMAAYRALLTALCRVEIVA